MKYYVDLGGIKPERGHRTDAGMDLKTPIEITVPAKGSVTIDTLLHVEIPEGYFGKLESKSGLHVKHDIVCLGGTIDCGYTGTVVVKLYNMGSKDYTFHVGDKIVQMIVQPCVLEEWIDDNNFCDTDRGIGGFGSTGR